MVAAAVIVHLATDGKIFIDQTQSNITVQLVDTKEGIHSLGKKWSMSFRYHSSMPQIENRIISVTTVQLGRW